WLSLTTLPSTPSPEAESEPQPAAEIASLLERSRATAGSAVEGKLLEWYRRIDPGWLELRKAVEDHAARAPRPQLTKVLITSEGLPAVRLHTQGADFFNETYYLKRGDPNQKLGVAPPGFLTVLTRAGENEDRWRLRPPEGWRTSWRRRSLAGWITDAERGAG